MLDLGFIEVSDLLPASDKGALLEAVLTALEEQLARLDALGARIAAAHVSAAVEHLRLDLLDERLAGATRH
jgi:hypothetical protein